jgi:hypothetical protein
MHHALVWHCILGGAHGLREYLTTEDTLVACFRCMTAVNIGINFF